MLRPAAGAVRGAAPARLFGRTWSPVFLPPFDHSLTVLRQRARFEALHWFESVNLHLREEGRALEARRAEASGILYNVINNNQYFTCIRATLYRRPRARGPPRRGTFAREREERRRSNKEWSLKKGRGEEEEEEEGWGKWGQGGTDRL